jgi:hypothetical protein
MADSIVKAEPVAIAVTPKEALAFAENHWVASMQLLSNAIREELSNEDTALFHEWMLKKADDIDSFRELMRKRLLDVVKEKGTKVTDKGTLELDLGGGRVQRASPTTTLPDDKLTERVLKDKGVDATAHMNAIIKYKADESKLKALVEQGKLTADDLKKCYKPTSYKLGKTGMKSEDVDE